MFFSLLDTVVITGKLLFWPQLLGVSPANIAHDYSLTEIGLQPAIPYMSARMRKERIYRDNWKGAANMARARCALDTYSSAKTLACIAII